MARAQPEGWPAVSRLGPQVSAAVVVGLLDSALVKHHSRASTTM
ncbi:hypothetical protein [Streptomyces sp. NRRL S-920]|nr:hypothetical protein [Streptomyces sp. NRRL S-920]